MNSGETGGEITKRRKKHRKHTLGKPWDHTVHKHKYGFVEIENPEYYDNHDCFAPPEFLMRKATPEERREMVINYIIRRRGKPIDLEKLAVKLAVSKRTIQSLMRRLKDDQLIEVKPNFDEAGRQIRSSYLYIGPKCETYGSGLTIGMLYDLENRAGFRDWEWDDFSYKIKGVMTCMTCISQKVGAAGRAGNTLNGAMRIGLPASESQSILRSDTAISSQKRMARRRLTNI